MSTTHRSPPPPPVAIRRGTVRRKTDRSASSLCRSAMRFVAMSIQPSLRVSPQDKGGSPMQAKGGAVSQPRGDTTIQELLEGAGLTDVRVDPAFAHDFGRILRVVVDRPDGITGSAQGLQVGNRCWDHDLQAYREQPDQMLRERRRRASQSARQTQPRISAACRRVRGGVEGRAGSPTRHARRPENGIRQDARRVRSRSIADAFR